MKSCHLRMNKVRTFSFQSCNFYLFSPFHLALVRLILWTLPNTVADRGQIMNIWYKSASFVIHREYFSFLILSDRNLQHYLVGWDKTEKRHTILPMKWNNTSHFQTDRPLLDETSPWQRLHVANMHLDAQGANCRELWWNVVWHHLLWCKYTEVSDTRQVKKLAAREPGHCFILQPANLSSDNALHY